jgi:hypothetical protein
MTTIEELKIIIDSLPMVKSVNVPTEPSGFCTGTTTVLSTEPNWKDQIIEIAWQAIQKAKAPIGEITFHGYYGEKPIAGNSYYIQIRTVNYANIVRSVCDGRLD